MIVAVGNNVNRYVASAPFVAHLFGIHEQVNHCVGCVDESAGVRRYGVAVNVLTVFGDDVELAAVGTMPVEVAVSPA